MPDDKNTTIPGVTSLTYDQMSIILELQRLWLEVAFWMRAFFKSSLEDSADLPAVSAKLLELPTEFYHAFRPYFTEEESQKIYDIMYKLVSANYELVNAYKNNDTTAIDASTIKWYQGAREFAALLADMNIYWSESLLNSLGFQYGKLKIEEIIAYYNQEYELEISIYESLENVAVMLGDYLARGIIARNASIKAQSHSD